VLTRRPVSRTRSGRTATGTTASTTKSGPALLHLRQWLTRGMPAVGGPAARATADSLPGTVQVRGGRGRAGRQAWPRGRARPPGHRILPGHRTASHGLPGEAAGFCSDSKFGRCRNCGAGGIAADARPGPLVTGLVHRTPCSHLGAGRDWPGSPAVLEAGARGRNRSPNSPAGPRSTGLEERTSPRPRGSGTCDAWKGWRDRGQFHGDRHVGAARAGCLTLADRDGEARRGHGGLQGRLATDAEGQYGTRSRTRASTCGDGPAYPQLGMVFTRAT